MTLDSSMGNDFFQESRGGRYVFKETTLLGWYVQALYMYARMKGGGKASRVINSTRPYHLLPSIGLRTSSLRSPSVHQHLSLYPFTSSVVVMEAIVSSGHLSSRPVQVSRTGLLPTRWSFTTLHLTGWLHTRKPRLGQMLF